MSSSIESATASDSEPLEMNDAVQKTVDFFSQLGKQNSSVERVMTPGKDATYDVFARKLHGIQMRLSDEDASERPDQTYYKEAEKLELDEDARRGMSIFADEIVPWTIMVDGTSETFQMERRLGAQKLIGTLKERFSVYNPRTQGEPVRASEYWGGEISTALTATRQLPPAKARTIEQRKVSTADGKKKAEQANDKPKPRTEKGKGKAKAEDLTKLSPPSWGDEMDEEDAKSVTSSNSGSKSGLSKIQLKTLESVHNIGTTSFKAVLKDMGLNEDLTIQQIRDMVVTSPDEKASRHDFLKGKMVSWSVAAFAWWTMSSMFGQSAGALKDFINDKRRVRIAAYNLIAVREYQAYELNLSDTLSDELKWMIAAFEPVIKPMLSDGPPVGRSKK